MQALVRSVQGPSSLHDPDAALELRAKSLRKLEAQVAVNNFSWHGVLMLRNQRYHHRVEGLALRPDPGCSSDMASGAGASHAGDAGLDGVGPCQVR